MDSVPASRGSQTSTGPSPGVDDGPLVEGCRRGDRSVQRQLYERYADRVYAVVLKMTANRDEAFDLTQDIFLRVFEKIGDFRGDSALGTWIHRVAVNRVLHHLRRARLGRKVSDQIRGETSAYATATDPDLHIDLDAVLGDLPDDSRAILLLRYQQELSYTEIARVLEIPVGTVGSRLNQARELLRGRMAGYRGDATTSPTPDAASEGPA